MQPDSAKIPALERWSAPCSSGYVPSCGNTQSNTVPKLDRFLACWAPPRLYLVLRTCADSVHMGDTAHQRHPVSSRRESLRENTYRPLLRRSWWMGPRLRGHGYRMYTRLLLHSSTLALDAPPQQTARKAWRCRIACGEVDRIMFPATSFYHRSNRVRLVQEGQLNGHRNCVEGRYSRVWRRLDLDVK